MAKPQRMKVKFADEMPNSSDLVCPGCRKRFVSPLLLPCLHTLCKKCIDGEKISPRNGSLPSCLVCSKVLDVRGEFPINFVVNNLVNKAAVQDHTPLELSVIAVKPKEKALRHDAMIVSYSCANFVLQHIAE